MSLPVVWSPRATRKSRRMTGAGGIVLSGSGSLFHCVTGQGERRFVSLCGRDGQVRPVAAGTGEGAAADQTDRTAPEAERPDSAAPDGTAGPSAASTHTGTPVC